jgi:hypothetical protein
MACLTTTTALALLGDRWIDCCSRSFRGCHGRGENGDCCPVGDVTDVRLCNRCNGSFAITTEAFPETSTQYFSTKFCAAIYEYMIYNISKKGFLKFGMR